MQIVRHQFGCIASLLVDALQLYAASLGARHRYTDWWGVYTIQQTSSKLPADVFKIHVNCWTFAGSCKHPMSDHWSRGHRAASVMTSKTTRDVMRRPTLVSYGSDHQPRLLPLLEGMETIYWTTRTRACGTKWPRLLEVKQWWRGGIGQRQRVAGRQCWVRHRSWRWRSVRLCTVHPW